MSVKIHSVILNLANISRIPGKAKQSVDNYQITLHVDYKKQ